MFSASNTAGRGDAYPKNPGRDPFAISTSGWYYLQHDFYDAGAGVVAVDLSILNATGSTIKTWTLSDLTDIANDTAGGNRYGWFASNEFPFLAIDNSSLTVVPEPATMVVITSYSIHYTKLYDFSVRDYLRARFLRSSKPPRPSSAIVAGSGTAAIVTLVGLKLIPLESVSSNCIVSLSRQL